MTKYNPNLPAIDNLTATCPVCDAEGLNRIWDCGSIIVSGKFEQGGDCHGELTLVETINHEGE